MMMEWIELICLVLLVVEVLGVEVCGAGNLRGVEVAVSLLAFDHWDLDNRIQKVGVVDETFLLC